jgi:hypothetical protein
MTADVESLQARVARALDVHREPVDLVGAVIVMVAMSWRSHSVC